MCNVPGLTFWWYLSRRWRRWIRTLIVTMARTSGQPGPRPAWLFFCPPSEEPRRRTRRTPLRRRGLPTPPRGVPSLVFWPHRTRTAAASPASINCAARVAPLRPHSRIRTASSGLPEAPAPSLPEDWGCARPQKATPVKQSPGAGLSAPSPPCPSSPSPRRGRHEVREASARAASR